MSGSEEKLKANCVYVSIYTVAYVSINDLLLLVLCQIGFEGLNLCQLSEILSSLVLRRGLLLLRRICVDF